MGIRSTFLGLLAAAAGPAVLGHDTWLIPQQFSVPAQGEVRLHLTSGATFNGLSILIDPARVQRAFGRVAAAPFLITAFTAEPKSLGLRVTPPGNGIAVMAVDLKPRKLVLEPNKIAEYLDDIGADAPLRKRWENRAHPGPWTELYIKHAKAFVRVGDCTGDRSWGVPLNATLEIVPDDDPTQVKVQDKFSVRVLKSGVPVPDFALGCASNGEAHHQIIRTDAQGRVTFAMTAPGVWLVHGTDLRPSIEPGLEWESDFATLVVEVHG